MRNKSQLNSDITYQTEAIKRLNLVSHFYIGSNFTKAFISSKIFNSSESLLQFLRQNSQLNERILSTVKKRIYELIIEYIKNRKQEVSGYLDQIKQTCMVSFLGDQNSLVKEVSLLVLFKIIETYKEIEQIIKPAELMNTLLDEIKLRRPAATVKGAIWQLVGLLHSQYPSQVSVYIAESQDVQYQMLEEQVRTKKPEIKAIIGMLKGFQHSFEVECTLDQQQKKGLFLQLSTLSQPIEDVNNRGVMKAAMKLLSQHANIFTDQIMSQSMSLIERCLQLCTFENIDVRDAANDLLGSLIKQISDNLLPSSDEHIRMFRHIMHQFDEILHSYDYKNVQLLSAIRAVGIFSKAIQTILGQEKLWEYLQSLTELSEQKLIKEFMDQDKPESDLHNFKHILKKQKQLIAYIESYSFIIRNVNREPSEAFLLHFMKVGSIGVNNHRKLYNKYRFRFYESLAQLTMSLTGFQNSFSTWIKKFVRQSLTETLKIPDSVVFGGESPADSLQDAVMFWKEYLCKDLIWTEVSCRQVYDEIISTCIQDVENLDLNYKINRTANTPVNQQEDEQSQFDSDLRINQISIEYIANNSNDQQYLVRLTNFLEQFLPNCKDQWLQKWIPRFCQILVRKATATPRIPKLYVLLKTVIQISSKHQYFHKQQISSQVIETSMLIDQYADKQAEEEAASAIEADSECINTYNMLLTFLKELIGKSEEFQDELLESTLSLLLNVPIVIIYQAESTEKCIDNLHLWKGVMIKSLVLSQLNNRLAMTCINTLEKWFNALPVSLVAQLYADVLPKLSDFLSIEQGNSGKNQDTYFFQDLIKETKEERVDRRDIANKVLDLLGKIGGHAHSIINNDLTKKHDKKNFIRWDSEKRIKFALPLNQVKIDIYLDSCLPRIIDLSQNSSKKETRVAACELLHALILYMIGKSATKPKGHKNTVKESEDMAAFANLYARLFPVIIRLATEIEQISRQLFEPLVFQIVRWFSSSKIYEHPEVESLLDALIEGTQSRNNSALREMCSNAVAVFAKWSLKQMTDKEIQENPSNIKSLLRRIESNSNHPDPFKRLSSVICFSKILMVVKDFDPLIDRFLLEIARCVLSSLKMCHNSLEFSQDVIENCAELLAFIQKLIIKKSELLFRENLSRSVHVSLYEFLDFLFVRFTAVETVYRQEATKLWQGIVLSLPKKLDIKSLIQQKYVPDKGEKSVFWTIQLIQFTKINKSQKQNGIIDSKKAECLERQKQLDTLTAQLEFIYWLLKVGKFQYAELQSKLRIDIKTIRTNVGNFLYSVIAPNFDKVISNNSLQRLLTCKEDREYLTKSRIRLLTEFFVLLQQLSEGEIADFVPNPPLNYKLGSSFILNLSVQILIVPAAHKLNLLVQDYQLEKKLRTPCEAYIKRCLAIQQQNCEKSSWDLSEIVYKLAIVDLPLIDLNKISLTNSRSYNPRLLTNLLLGYLKLGQMSPTIKSQTQEIAQNLSSVVESWIKCENSPSQIESSRLLVNFMASLGIPNEILSEWLTNKSDVYHKTSDILLKYIAENWTRSDTQVGHYLIQKSKENLDLLYVFIPILQYISQKTPGYQKVLISKIPSNWVNATHNVEYAEKQVQIYSIILQKCSWSFESKNQDQEATTFINFVIQQAKNFLQSDKFSIYFQKQVLHLIGLLYSLNLSEQLHTKMKPVLEAFLTKQSPVVSRDLIQNKNAIANYEKLLEGYFDLLDLSKSPQILQIVKRVISEHKPQFLRERIKASLNNFVLNVINTQPTFSQFYQIIEPFFIYFFDETHTQLFDNYRWAVANKIINRVLETCQIEYLEDLLIKIFENKLKQSLERKLLEQKGLQLYMLVREQTHVMLMLEIFVRRLDADTIRGKITKTLYGADSPQNELIKWFIQVGENAKQEKVYQFEQRCQELESQIQLPELNSLKQVKRRYACAGYTLLSSTILKTQIKQIVFSDYLFGNWDVIIDVQDDKLYQFSVQTNFNSISLESIEAKAFKSKDMAQVKTLNLLNEYVTSSFMATNTNFNSAMVFETQLDQQTDKKFDQKRPFSIIQEQTTEQQSIEQEKNQNQTLEIDSVNKHECMKNIKRCLDRMQDLFKEQWEKDGEDCLPKFMQQLLDEITNGHLNIKIFILKLLVNNQDLFKPFAKFWIEPICNFICSKNTGGKGFHYFLRDLTTLLILWSDSFKPKEKLQKVCSQVVNTLVRLAADKSKIIFNINIEILAMLMHKWRSFVYIDKSMLVKMLNVPDQDDGSHLWKMTAIQVVALACTFDLPVINNNQPEQEIHKFILEEGRGKDEDPLLTALLNLQKLKKKQLIFASSEALGKVFSAQPSLAQTALSQIMSNDAKERHDILVNVIERITREYPQFLSQKIIFLKLTSYTKVMTGSMRGQIFKSLARYFHICNPHEQNDIKMSVIAICEDVLADISEENQKNFLILLQLIIKQDKVAGKDLLDKVAHKLKDLYVNNKSENIRELFYDLMVFIYDNFEEFKGVAKSSLIRGLSDSSKLIRQRIVEYWNSPLRLNNDPIIRTEQLMTMIYDQEEEQVWLNNSVFLLLQASQLSADFNRKIFDEPLQNCQFDPLHINQFKINLNRSQPVTPSLAQISAITASQYFNQQSSLMKQQNMTTSTNLVAIKEDALEDNDDQEMQDQSEEIINTSQDEFESQQRLKVAGQQNNKFQEIGKKANNYESAFAPGFVRSTQQQGAALFNPSQIISSSLVVSSLMFAPKANGMTGIYNQNQNSQQNSSQSDPSFSQAFYDPQQVIVKKQRLKIFKDVDADKDIYQQPGQQFQEPVFLTPIVSQDYSLKPQSARSKFFEQNQVGYAPVQTVQESQSMIRVVKDGSLPSQLARQEEIKRVQQNQIAKQYFSMKKQQINMLREYRVGEIPDIQIQFKDIILPLMALVQSDSTIATEVLVELFSQIYKESKSLDQRKKLGDGVSCMLSQSIKFDHGMINSMHRIAIELLKIDGFSIEADIIQTTGRSSMSFQTSLLLLEETILYGNKIKDLSDPKNTKIVKKADTQNTTAPVMQFGKVTNASKSYWFSLIQLYELVGNEDALKGIWCSIGESKQVMLKDFDNQDKSSQQTSSAANLIREAQSYRAKGSIYKGLEVLERVLSSHEFDVQFEEQVKLEIINKKYESFAELLKWENISHMSLGHHQNRQLFDIPFLQAETMIRAQLRCENQWQQLNAQMQMWQEDPISKVYLERRFNYEQALMFITAKDFDRARFYVNREANDLLLQWKDLTKLSQVAQHILVQKIQKIYEMKEFLNTSKQLSLKEYDQLTPEALQQISNWVQRQPSYSFDKLSVWDDILTSRMLFIDLYKMNFKQGSSFVNQLDSKAPTKFKDVQNIGAKLYAQVAKGAFKMGLYDSCNKYLLTCLNRRRQDNQKDNLRISVPIIKLKIEQFKQETINMSNSNKYNELVKVLTVLDGKISKELNQDEDFSTQIKALHVKQQLHKKLLNIVYKDMMGQKDQKNKQALTSNILSHIQMAFKANDNILSVIEKVQHNNEALRAKNQYSLSKLCDKLLRQLQNESILVKGFNSIGQTVESLAISTIKNCFQSINLGYLKARDSIPRLLDIVDKVDTTTVDNVFIESSKETPAWIFLRWINQMAAVINRKKSEVIADKIRQISRKYPQALYYPFSVLQSNLQIQMLEVDSETTPLFKKIQQMYDNKFQNLIDWKEALVSLVYPEHRFKQWVELIDDASKQGNEQQRIAKCSTLMTLMIQDIANTNQSSQSPKNKLGEYNRKFAQKWNTYLTAIMKKKQTINSFITELKDAKDKVQQIQLGHGNQKLNLFSEFLHDLDNNDFYQPEVYIEIPGQYENINNEPIQVKNVKIACVRKTILILPSLTRPKRITVHGSNEKDYHLLIKGGEDLRLDQRIQQLFQIMNDIFKEDPACQSRDLNLKTFNVVPITNCLGILEWVDNTQPLKSIIDREHIRVNKNAHDTNKSAAHIKRLEWISKLPGNKEFQDRLEIQHLNLINQNTEIVVDNFNIHKQLMPWALLRQGLENLCLTSSAFITIKNQFVKSLAVFSIASYLLGIGDRHLENFLVNTTDGEILGIDFGVSFGSGIQLTVPELMPFRLTQQIEGVIAPHPMDGIYKQTMVHVLTALRKRKSMILDTCDIFVKEPLLDWVKKAQQKLVQQYENTNRNEELLRLSFYPQQKIQIVKDKLNGANPIIVMHRELKDSQHFKRPYYNKLLIALQGPEDSIREKLLKREGSESKLLEVEEQVDCLIELARCPDILGRAWIGWRSYL